MIDNKYYYKDYLKINDKNIQLINNKYNNDHNNLYKINYFYNYLYNDSLKIYFLEKNNKFYFLENDLIKCYYLDITENNDYLLIIEEIYNKIFVDDNIFNVDIYREFNKDLDYMNNNELYLNWIKTGFNEGRIYSVQSF